MKFWKVLMIIIDILIVVGIVAAIWWAVVHFGGGSLPSAKDVFQGGI